MQRYAVALEHETAPAAGGIVIMHAETGMSYSLNAVGALVWELLSTAPATAEELCETVRRRFDVDPERCAEDVALLLGDLERNGLASGVP